MRRALLVLPLMLCLSGCNWITQISGLTKESDKAIGASCRQIGLSLADCFLHNPNADKSAIYAGWREMHEYMVKEKLPTMTPPVDAAAASAPMPQAGNANGAGGDKPDPEVQAVLDTINNRPQSAASEAQPSASEQQQLQQQLNSQKNKKN
jgi:hypothetical protein